MSKKIAAFDYMIENNRYRCSFDPWVPSDYEDYKSVKDMRQDQHNYRGEIFVVSHTEGGGVGMGEYPSCTNVVRIRKQS